MRNSIEFFVNLFIQNKISFEFSSYSFWTVYLTPVAGGGVGVAGSWCAHRPHPAGMRKIHPVGVISPPASHIGLV